MLRCAVVNRSHLACCVGHAVRFIGCCLPCIAHRILARVIEETAATRQPGANGFLGGTKKIFLLCWHFVCDIYYAISVWPSKGGVEMQLDAVFVSASRIDYNFL